MYSTIANNTFSYFLTLNEFRERLKREHPEIEPSWIKLTTITMISQFKRGINIQFLKDFFEEYELKLARKGKEKRKFIWRMKDTTFYNQISLVYEDYHSTKSIKVFPNGSIQVAGCADLFDCKRVIKQLSCMFSRILGKEYVIPEDTKNGNYEQALRDFEYVISRTNNHALAYKTAAKAAEQIGLTEKACSYHAMEKQIMSDTDNEFHKWYDLLSIEKPCIESTNI